MEVADAAHVRSVGVLERQAVRRPGWLIALALALLAGGLALGTWSGEWLFRRTAGRNYRPAALAVLLVIGAVATARAVWGLAGL